MLEAALGYAAQGVPVFPVSVRFDETAGKFRKRPLTDRGHYDRTTDEARIRDWWARWPWASIAVVPADQGCVVIDLDVGWREDPDTLAWVKGLPQTREARTPTGGVHLYYDTFLEFSNSKPVPHVDIRSANGWVVAPPSEGYVWVVRSEPVHLPPAFEAKLSPAKQGDRDPSHDGDDSHENILRALNYLDDARPAIEGQGGDLWTWKVACVLVRDIGLSDAEALHCMLARWNDRCEPPWDPEELEKKVWNAGEYGRHEPSFNYAPVSAIPNAYKIQDYTARGWLNRDVPSKRRLIGPFNHDSKVVLSGPTGIGKTHIMMAIGGHLAAGKQFMHWRVPEPKRVLYIDGEMPLSLLQKRLHALQVQLNAGDEWLDRFVLISTLDFPKVPPLDNGGLPWVDQWIEYYKPDLLILDNLMSLTEGDKVTNNGVAWGGSWTTIEPWVKAKSHAGLCVLIGDHSKKNGERAGAQRKSFLIDTEMLLTKPDDDPGRDVVFDLSFSKHREREDDNRDDYELGRVSLRHNQWAFKPMTDVTAGLIRKALAGQAQWLTTEQLGKIIAQMTGKTVAAATEMLRRAVRAGNEKVLEFVDRSEGRAWKWKSFVSNDDDAEW